MFCLLYIHFPVSTSSLLYFKTKKVRKKLGYLLKPAQFINTDIESMCKPSLRL